MNYQQLLFNMYGTRRCFTNSYQIDRKNAGLVIGPKGAGIREIKNLSGVLDVRFDTRHPGDTCPLIIKGVSENVCNEAFLVVQQRWIFGNSFKKNKPGIEQVFIDVGSHQKIILKPKSDESTSKIIARDFFVQGGVNKEKFLFSGYETKTVEDDLDSLNLSNQSEGTSYWMQMSMDAFTSTLNKALEKMNDEERRSFDLNVTPGKYSFLCDKGRWNREIIPDRSGHIAKKTFKAKNIQPVFSNALKREFCQHLAKSLQIHGFSNLNEGSPEQFTRVHLIAGEQEEQFSVDLALDEHLQELDENSDLRVSEDKKKAVESIFKARTILEVMGNTELKPKIAFYKLSLLVHPDKNAHPGATEAFKKLQHAYEKMSAGEKDSSAALDIGNITQLKGAGKPPKVISVKVKKRRVANITFFTSEILDTRMSLTTFQENPEKLTSHIRDVLNNCWEKRDLEGGIPTPDGNSGIFIRCLKQITAGHIWVKSIKTVYGDAVIEVKVKEMREKIDNQKDWQECLEIDMTIIMDDDEKENMEADKLACYVKEIQNIWNMLMTV